MHSINENADTNLLRFPEEILLLLLDDDSGKIANINDWSLRYALAGAALMELAFANRIDSDLEHLLLVDSSPIGEAAIDAALAEIVAEKDSHGVRFWLEKLAVYADDIRASALQGLVDKGVLQQRDELFLWVFKSRVYPAVDGKAEREVKLRIAEVLFGDIIPDPRDVVVIALAAACGIFNVIFSERELEHSRERIDQVKRLDLIGQEVSKAIWDIESSLIYAMQPQGL